MSGSDAPAIAGAKPRRARIARILLAAAGLVLLAALFTCRDDGMDCCAQCGSYRDVTSWGLGVREDERVALVLSADEVVRPTRALADLFPSDHRHEWDVSYSRRWGPACGGIAVCGGRYRNGFANAYEAGDALRDFVLGEIRAGRVGREEVKAMLALSERPWNDTQSEKLLRTRAFRWMREHAPEAPIGYMGGVPGSAQAEAELRRARAGAADPRAK